MRADRLLSILWLLQAHGGLSTTELARRLETSARTILRDVDALSSAGVPIYCERGRAGGVRLLPGFRADVSALTEEEGRALFSAITSWGPESLGLKVPLASALRKVLAALPQSAQSGAGAVFERIVIDHEGWLPSPQNTLSEDSLKIVQEAVFSDRKLSFKYWSSSKQNETRKVVDPYGLLSSGGTWYLCASDNKTVTFFRLSRIRHASILDKEVIRPTGIDVRELWRERREKFVKSLTPISVVAWVRERRANDLNENTIAVNRIDSENTSQIFLDNWSKFKLDFVDEKHAMSVVFMLGVDINVISPIDLRKVIAEHAREIYEAHVGTN